MRIEGAGLESMLVHSVDQPYVAGPREGPRGQGGVRAAQSVTDSQEQSALAVHLSASGQALSAAVGSAGLNATARTQGSSHAMDVGSGHGRSAALPVSQAQTLQRIVEQVTGQRLGVFNGVDLRSLAQVGAGVLAGGPASTTDPAAALALVYQASQLQQYAASGMATAADGTRVGFTVTLTLDGRLAHSRHLHMRFSRLGGALPQPEPEPALEPKAEVEPAVAHAGPSSELLGHTFVFDLGVANSADADQVQMVGNGSVAFNQTKTFSVEDLQAALRSIKVV